MVRIHPGGFRLLLAGPKVSKVLPFLQARGFVGDACVSGQEALAKLRRSPCHVLLLELELGDMMGVDLARTGKAEGLVGGTLLLEDPIKSGMVVAALCRGVDAFVAVPPDEAVFLEKIEGLLLAQWGLVVQGQQQVQTDELAQLRRALAESEEQLREAAEGLEQQTRKVDRDLADERKKVRQLVGEIASLRDQLTTMHLLTGAKTGNSDEGNAADMVDFDEPGPTSDLTDLRGPTRNQGFDPDGDFENERTQALAPHLAASLLRDETATHQMRAPGADDFGLGGATFEGEATPMRGTAPDVPTDQRFGNANEDTAPGGHQVPSQLEVSPKPKRRPGGTAVDLDSDMLKDLSRLHTAGDEEVIFLEDD